MKFSTSNNIKKQQKLSQAAQQNLDIVGIKNTNKILNNKVNVKNAIDGSDLFKQLLSQKISRDEEGCNDLSSKAIPQKSNNDMRFKAADTPSDSTIQLKPRNVEFGNTMEKRGETEYAISTMGAEAIKLQEEMQTQELLNADLEVIDSVAFNEMISNSPLIYHASFAIDNSEVTKHLTPEEYAQPIEILSCEASAQSFMFAPETPLAALGDWQVNYLKNPSAVKSDSQNRSVNTMFMVGQDNSNFADFELMNNLEDSIKISHKEIDDIAMKLEVSPDFQLNSEMIQIFNTYNANLSDEIEFVGQHHNLAIAVGKQVSNAISNVSMNVLKSGGIEVSLYPESLGHVKITCNVGEKTEVHIAAEKISTLMLLQQNADSIKETLLNSTGNKTSVDLHFNQKNQDNTDAKQSHENMNFGKSDLKQSGFENDITLCFIHDGVINFIV